MAFFRSKLLFGVDENTGAANHRYQMPKTRTWREHGGLDFVFSLLEKISSTIGVKDSFFQNNQTLCFFRNGSRIASDLDDFLCSSDWLLKSTGNGVYL
ncbi:unnamed protein product [Arabidopsis thaliana]|uniref:Uncharacterized protein n=1 Tax=Arabidopsis thaliana TaxID=3702 RepID=A0A654FCZ7_ARATH|nr:unnamed protein product [Arabidopsis thaliana]